MWQRGSEEEGGRKRKKRFPVEKPKFFRSLSLSLALLLGSLTAIKLFCKMHKDFVKWKNMENFYISMKSNAI